MSRHAAPARPRLLLVAMLAFGCANHSGLSGERSELPAGQSYQRLDAEVYTPADWPEELTATVYRPAAPGPHPAVLVVHGGGWNRRSPADMKGICRALAERGFVAVNVAYRLAPAYLYPAPLEDLGQALAWMVANAERLELDPGRIGGFGYSAGAHLVSLVALRDTEPDAHGPDRRPGLRAVVAGGTPADLTRWPDSKLVKRFLGQSLEADPGLWKEASPISHVSAASPPFFLYHGGLDRLVEVEQAEALQSQLSDAGVHAELYTVPYYGHVSMFVLNRSAVRKGAAFLAEMLR